VRLTGAVTDAGAAAANSVSRAAPLTLRLVAGLLWLSNVGWKVPPDFGKTAGGCRGLCRFVQAGIDHPVVPGYAWVLEELIQPNLALFGWGVLVLEYLLAAFLLSGTLTRLAAAAGFAQSLAIGLSVANAPEEWYWSYVLMAALHLAVFAMAGGAARADTVPRAASPGDPGRSVTGHRVSRPVPVAVLTAAYGVLVAVANARNAIITSDFTREWLLFGGRTDFPGDFGRNVFAGSVALGLLFVVLAGATLLTAGRSSARWTAGIAAAFSLLLVAAYRDTGNLLAARPSAAAVMLAVALYLATSAAPRAGEGVVATAA
jgi:uncharacterized membrane protein YphA (DoxX/SURF4 family)